MAATTPVLSRASDSDGAEEGAPVSPLLPVSRYGAVDTPEAAVQGASGGHGDPAQKGASKSPSKHRRLASLDVMRGLTMAAMIAADDIDQTTKEDKIQPYPHLNHSPWSNVTFADFVMPWFLFFVGAAMAFSLRRYKAGGEAGRREGTKKAVIRAIKLYVIGTIMQGGGLPDNYTYGYNLYTLRMCGILQRIGFAYLVVALGELWLPVIDAPRLARWPHLRHLVRHGWQWVLSLAMTALYLALMFGTFVPSWESNYGIDPETGNKALLAEPFTITCDVRGAIDTPACAANGYWDRALFGQDRLGTWMSTRLPQCSTCSPGSCAPPANATGSGPDNWCFAHMYDPEGALATVATVASCWLGLHFSHVLASNGRRGTPALFTTDSSRLTHWVASSVVLIVGGLAIHFGGFPMNKQLWSTSYVLFMAGTCGLGLTLCYILMDCEVAAAAMGERVCRLIRWLLDPLRAMGLNAILLFCWHGPAEALINIVYVLPPKVGGGLDGDPETAAFVGPNGWFHQKLLLPLCGHDPVGTQMLYVIIKVACFCAAMVVCMRRGYFWKV